MRDPTARLLEPSSAGAWGATPPPWAIAAPGRPVCPTQLQGQHRCKAAGGGLAPTTPPPPRRPPTAEQRWSQMCAAVAEATCEGACGSPQNPHSGECGGQRGAGIPWHRTVPCSRCRSMADGEQSREEVVVAKLGQLSRRKLLPCEEITLPPPSKCGGLPSGDCRSRATAVVPTSHHHHQPRARSGAPQNPRDVHEWLPLLAASSVGWMQGGCETGAEEGSSGKGPLAHGVCAPCPGGAAEFCGGCRCPGTHPSSGRTGHSGPPEVGTWHGSRRGSPAAHHRPDSSRTRPCQTPRIGFISSKQNIGYEPGQLPTIPAPVRQAPKGSCTLRTPACCLIQRLAPWHSSGMGCSQILSPARAGPVAAPWLSSSCRGKPCSRGRG